ncbi:bifunctional GTP diphosphokinase/guanosine-3',5'-bis pyrophosphate 3'-pyrophosphohydrolase [Allopseudospirillum japonicum]|nr:bifunctional GTP diphosphokinase/guanosine-3',5'-bis pyrophosphate 3'-pyrophosphohydrolase [Allopseudospirillum japonicum]
MMTIDDLADRLKGYLPPEEVQAVRRAYYYAEQAHFDQRRSSGEPYVTHPLMVAHILANIHMDYESLIAALLHDVIEDTRVTKEAVAQQFGESVASLVDGVTKLTQIPFSSKAEAQAENFRKMVMAMALDIRVIIVKLADRLHNMRTLGALRRDKKVRIARETLEIYAPIAHRLGINTFRLELEELSFQAIYPMRAERIRRAIASTRGHRKEVVKKIQQVIQQRLEDEGIVGRVIGREKHLWSIYSKMRERKKSFKEIMDVYGFRIITDNVDNTYRALGVVHNLYKPVEDRFKDYIAIPKANGYQSLHTSLIGMNGIPIEVQIRTRDMEEMANKGIASHWLYKAGKTDKPIGGVNQDRTRQWVKGLLEMQRHAGNSLEFIEHVKDDLFPDEIYIFTPKGEIMTLPVGATPVDFAYFVHTDIGNACVACRVDRRLAPLSQALRSGQTVEIITAPGARPNLAWLNFITTARARSAVHHFLKNQQVSESVTLGKRLLERALVHFDAALEDVQEHTMHKVLQDLGYQQQQDLLEAIGLGTQMAYVIARKLLGLVETETQAVASRHTLAIRGTEGMVTTYARCCYPLPGDPIIGHISSGRGIVIHREQCPNLNEVRQDPEKCTPVHWAEDIDRYFPVALRVELANQKGNIAQLATIATELDANLEQINTDEKDAHLSIINLIVSVQNRIHLAQLMKKIRKLTQVHRIVRR